MGPEFWHSGEVVQSTQSWCFSSWGMPSKWKRLCHWCWLEGDQHSVQCSGEWLDAVVNLQRIVSWYQISGYAHSKLFTVRRSHYRYLRLQAPRWPFQRLIRKELLVAKGDWESKAHPTVPIPVPSEADLRQWHFNHEKWRQHDFRNIICQDQETVAESSEERWLRYLFIRYVKRIHSLLRQRWHIDSPVQPKHFEHH